MCYVWVGGMGVCAFVSVSVSVFVCLQMYIFLVLDVCVWVGVSLLTERPTFSHASLAGATPL